MKRKLLLVLSLCLIPCFVIFAACDKDKPEIPQDKEYTVTYNANGGEFDGGITAFEQKVKENTMLIAPASPIKGNYTFLGWAISFDSKEFWRFSIDKVTSNITLYAIWDPPGHEHTYSDKWIYDDDYHWRVATCEHHDLVKDKAGHTIGADNKCEVCDYIVVYAEGLKYQLNKDGLSYSVRGIGRVIYETDIIIPATCNDKPVTSIGDYAFAGFSSLASITIPDSVTSIGEGAFQSCSSLESITIPDSVTSIGDYAFYRCSSLESITIPDSVISIGDYAFQSCSSLKSVTIGDGVTSIGDLAFAECSSLESVAIGDGVISIGDLAFYNCSSLESVAIGDGVTNIGELAFAYCSSLESVFYKGTADEWEKIRIDSYNYSLTSATIYYYSEFEPTTEGNYWHYDTDGVTPTTVY